MESVAVARMKSLAQISRFNLLAVAAESAPWTFHISHIAEGAMAIASTRGCNRGQAATATRFDDIKQHALTAKIPESCGNTLTCNMTAKQACN